MRKFTCSVFVCAAVMLATVAEAFAQNAQTKSPATPAEQVVMMNEFAVIAEQDNGYRSANAAGASRTNTPIADTPQLVTIFNDLFIQDTFSANLTELANYNPSFQPTIADKGTYFSRGFKVNATFVDGMAQRNTFGPNYTANVDRVEFLQGPAAILYGDGPAGATINRVLKRASPRPSTRISMEIGDYTFQRTTLDTNGPLGANLGGRPLSYRVNVAVHDGNTWKLQSKNREQLYSPTVTIPLGAQTELYVNFTYDRTNLTGSFAEPVTNGVPGLVVLPNGTKLYVPIRNSTGEPIDSRPITKTLSSYDFVHRINKEFSFRSQYQYETYRQGNSEMLQQIGSYVFTATTASLNRIFRTVFVDYKADRLREELAGSVSTGAIKQKLLVGCSFDELNETDLTRQTSVAGVPPIDLVNPVYGLFTPPDLSKVPITTNSQTKNIIRSLYANDLASMFSERLFIQGGFRREQFYQRTNNRRTSKSTAVTTTTNTNSIGFVFHPTSSKNFSIWGSVSSSFEPNIQVNPDGSTLPATTGRNYEEGIKLDVLKNTLTFNVSAFHTERDKVPTADPNLVGYFYSGPGQTAQGFQVDGTYNPSRRFQILAGYVYLDAFTTAKRVTLENAPKNSFSGFARYEQIGGPLNGLFSTLGWIYRGTRDPAIAATGAFWKIPELKSFNVGLGYGWKRGEVRYQVALNIKNATDALLFADNNQTDRYVLLSPRSFLVSLRAQF